MTRRAVGSRWTAADFPTYLSESAFCPFTPPSWLLSAAATTTVAVAGVVAPVDQVHLTHRQQPRPPSSQSTIATVLSSSTNTSFLANEFRIKQYIQLSFFLLCNELSNQTKKITRLTFSIDRSFSAVPSVKTFSTTK